MRLVTRQRTVPRTTVCSTMYGAIAPATSACVGQSFRWSQCRSTHLALVGVKQKQSWKVSNDL
jgi:hypothetical protein